MLPEATQTWESCQRRGDANGEVKRSGQGGHGSLAPSV